jgi:phage shock protein PspC (stress-responsive transcriptional regulator)
MKQVIHINYQGRIVPIEVSAFELLKAYKESLERHFKDENGKEEIINDIEDRIGELFQERLQAGTHCITDADVNAIVTSMGKPEEFDVKEEDETKSVNNEDVLQNKGKRLYRSEQQKIIGGVCAGLSNYLNIDVNIVRVIFAVMFLIFGFGLIVYLVLWAIVPNSAAGQIGSTRKKLYRDLDHKVVGGVCSGISHYFGIEVWVP